MINDYLRPTPTGSALLIAILQLVLVPGGCAFANRDNTPTLNLVEDNLWPDSTGARVLLFPVIFPTGLVAVVLDTFIVHPVSVIDDAIEDTGDVLWDNWDWDTEYVTECASIPWRALMTPLFFTGDLLGRSIFDISDRAEEERQAAEARQSEAVLRDGSASAAVEAGAFLDEGKPSEALDRIIEFRDFAEELLPSSTRGKADHLAEIRLLALEAAHLSGRYYEIYTYNWVLSLKKTRFADEAEAILVEMKNSDNPLARWAVFMSEMDYFKNYNDKLPGLRRALSDPSPMMRYSALELIDKRYWMGRDLIPELRRIAGEDPDPIIRTFGRELIDRVTPLLDKKKENR